MVAGAGFEPATFGL